MGANAGTAVPVYASGEVLTAARLNLTNCGVPVFSGTATRDAAFGGSGEKVLAEGQLAYLEDADVVQYYTGAAWATVGPQAVVASGLELISTTTIGTTVSTVTVSNAFSSTYDNYLIQISGGVSSSSALGISMTLGATTTGYYRAGFYNTYTSATVSGDVEANAASWGVVALGTTDNLNGNIFLFNPNQAKSTVFHSVSTYTSTTGRIWVNGGYVANTTQYTAFTISAGAQTFTGGTIRVYGFKN